MKLTLPDGLKAGDCERGKIDALGGPPPIRFVPELTERDSDAKVATCTFKLADEGKDTYAKFDGGTSEEALLHVQLVHLVNKKLECKDNFDFYEGEIARFKAEKEALERDLNMGLDVSQASIDEKSELLDEARYNKKGSLDTAWQTFERLLTPSQISKWSQAEKKAQTQSPHVDANGVLQLGERGKTWESLDAAIRLWLLKVTKMQPNAAERLKDYMSVQVKMPAHKGLTVRQFVDRLIEMNEYLPFLPTQKEVEGAPPELKNGKEPLTEMELCQVVLRAVPYHLGTAYYAKQKKGHYPMDLEAVTDELTALEPEFNRTQTLVEKARKESGKGKPKAQSDSSKQDGGDAAKPAAKKPKGSGSGKKHCNNCARYSPQIQHTHNTNDCRKWEKDGTPKHVPRKSNVHSHDDEMKKMFMAHMKEQKAFMKSMSRKGGKSKRGKGKRRFDESDSSSDESY